MHPSQRWVPTVIEGDGEADPDDHFVPNLRLVPPLP